ncbi:uncharacterized protein BCR38DRAFT_486145 [Pseudomassariella vexata]|uniref:Myb-like domain-containing protein n=1 Tax=Pseudomassariella vexata TaxID=1141098 RepID=A0A1Y2DW37_9PEZI|nr:uncharacterized protein BCR38DRAFT_486145 [Pseudomassariella vexata]ORY63399.1 hypothetical protein BCR38DRAFT_486145 [Pseudomassariella vexata]
MDDGKWFPHIADGGDEYLTEDLYSSDCFSSGFGSSHHNVRTQPSTTGYISAAATTPVGAGGNEIGPSQHGNNHSYDSHHAVAAQPNKESGAVLAPNTNANANANDSCFWPPLSTTNMYSLPFDGSTTIDTGFPTHYQQQPNHAASWSVFDTWGGGAAAAALTNTPLHFHDSLPAVTTTGPWGEPSVPNLGEAIGCNSVSPTGTTYSSISSSAASDAMTSMSLDPVTHSTAPVNTPSTTNSFSMDDQRYENQTNVSATGSGTCAGAGAADWIMGNTNDSNYPPTTVSPEVLRINPSPAPVPNSYTESVQTSLLRDSDFDISPSYVDIRPAPSRAPQAPQPSSSSKRLNNKGRKELPSRPKSRYLSVAREPPSSSSSATSSKGKGKASAAPSSIHGHHHHHHHQSASSSARQKAAEQNSVSLLSCAFRAEQENGDIGIEDPNPSDTFEASDADLPNPNPPLRPRPKPTAVLLPRPSPSTSVMMKTSAAASSRLLETQAAEKAAKDEFLIKHKRAGMTYREIRKKGKFIEAESTLRGRYRTLTKPKETRVRKPEWEESDIRLLKKAVRKLAKGDDLETAKIPWKQVAEYIAEHGGSYHFGNATCRKRWDDLLAQNKA